MKYTPTQAAQAAAEKIIREARIQENAVITTAFVEEIMRSNADTDWGRVANIRTVRAQLRALNGPRGVPMALTPREEYVMNRAWMRELSLYAFNVLRDQITDDDPRANDKPFVDAMHATWSPRLDRLTIPPALAAWGERYAKHWAYCHRDAIAREEHGESTAVAYAETVEAASEAPAIEGTIIPAGVTLGTEAEHAGNPDVRAAIEVLSAAGFTPAPVRAGEIDNEDDTPSDATGFMVIPRPGRVLVYHVRNGSTLAPDRDFWRAELRSYRAALRGAGWTTERPMRALPATPPAQVPAPAPVAVEAHADDNPTANDYARAAAHLLDVPHVEVSKLTNFPGTTREHLSAADAVAGLASSLRQSRVYSTVWVEFFGDYRVTVHHSMGHFTITPDEREADKIIMKRDYLPIEVRRAAFRRHNQRCAGQEVTEPTGGAQGERGGRLGWVLTRPRKSGGGRQDMYDVYGYQPDGRGLYLKGAGYMEADGTQVGLPMAGPRWAYDPAPFWIDTRLSAEAEVHWFGVERPARG